MLALVLVVPVVMPRAAAAPVALPIPLAVRVPIAFVTFATIAILLPVAPVFVAFARRLLALSARRGAAVVRASLAQAFLALL